MKLDYPKAWYELSAEIEGNAEVGVGLLPIYGNDTNDVKSYPSCFGRFVELWRGSQGWNLERLATAAKIEPREMVDMERDPFYLFEADQVCRLADVFGVPRRRLMQLAEYNKPSTVGLRERPVRYGMRCDPLAPLSEEEWRELEWYLERLEKDGVEW